MPETIVGHCEHCPVAAALPCVAERARGLCRKVDPADPQYGQEWLGALISHAEQQAAGLLRQPSLSQQARSLATSLWDWACSGFAVASHDEQRRRMNICAVCPQWDAAANRCRICGCQLAAKIAMRTEHCPEGRW